MARWLGTLFATRPRRHSSATGTPGLELSPLAPRRAPAVAPGQAPGEAPAVKAPCPTSMLAPRVAPLATSRQPSAHMEVRRIFSGDGPPKPSAQDQARRLLEHLQGEPSLAGHVVPANDVEWAYLLLCDMHKWPELPWQRVAVEFKGITGGKRPLSPRRWPKRVGLSHPTRRSPLKSGRPFWSLNRRPALAGTKPPHRLQAGV